MAESLPRISEHELPAKTAQLLKEVSVSAVQYLGLDPERTPTAEIVKQVDLQVHGIQTGKVAAPKDEEVELFFGCAWGEQLVRAFGWQWTGVTFHEYEDSKAIGVISPDRSLAIYPFHFIQGCLENGAPVTILLAFNMLGDGAKIPRLPPRGYENVMDKVHHIVPRRD